ncbi:hypothetical protein [uncultured Hymenobacter sp.]|uniref:hypothetical protein n=1 Tax=uncultured Hymenobacter sp. TaxID=170016 RepID=UPI0035CA6F90
MFKPTTLRVFAIVAMLLSVIGLALSLLMAQDSGSLIFAIGSWVLLLWASYLGFRLSSYKLDEEEYRKVGVRVYLIIVAFGAFMTVGLMVGLALSAALLATLWGLKKNYDEWIPTPVVEDEAGSIVD